MRNRYRNLLGFLLGILLSLSLFSIPTYAVDEPIIEIHTTTNRISTEDEYGSDLTLDVFVIDHRNQDLHAFVQFRYSTEASNWGSELMEEMQRAMIMMAEQTLVAQEALEAVEMAATGPSIEFYTLGFKSDAYLEAVRTDLISYLDEFPMSEGQIPSDIFELLEIEESHYQYELDLGDFYFPDATLDNLEIHAWVTDQYGNIIASQRKRINIVEHQLPGLPTMVGPGSSNPALVTVCPQNPEFRWEWSDAELYGLWLEKHSKWTNAPDSKSGWAVWSPTARWHCMTEHGCTDQGPERHLEASWVPVNPLQPGIYSWSMAASDDVEDRDFRSDTAVHGNVWTFVVDADLDGMNCRQLSARDIVQRLDLAADGNKIYRGIIFGEDHFESLEWVIDDGHDRTTKIDAKKRPILDLGRIVKTSRIEQKVKVSLRGHIRPGVEFVIPTYEFTYRPVNVTLYVMGDGLVGFSEVTEARGKDYRGLTWVAAQDGLNNRIFVKDDSHRFNREQVDNDRGIVDSERLYVWLEAYYDGSYKRISNVIELEPTQGATAAFPPPSDRLGAGTDITSSRTNAADEDGRTVVSVGAPSTNDGATDAGRQPDGSQSEEAAAGQATAVASVTESPEPAATVSLATAEPLPASTSVPTEAASPIITSVPTPNPNEVALAQQLCTPANSDCGSLLDQAICLSDNELYLAEIAVYDQILDRCWPATNRGEGWWIIGAVSFFNRASNLNDIGVHDLALKDVEEALALCFTVFGEYDSRCSGEFRLRGEIQHALGNENKAFVDLNTAIDLKESAYNYSARGEVNLDLHRYDLALADFSAAIELEQPDVNWWFIYHRGLAYAGMGQQVEAEADFTAVLDNAPLEWQELRQRAADALRQLN